MRHDRLAAAVADRAENRRRMGLVTTRIGELLRHARRLRGVSQFDLGLSLGVSQRHVSFVESGRARPSRTLIETWTQTVGASRSMRNAALHCAGYSASALDDAASDERAPARAALGQLLEMHEPFPGIVFRGDWTMAGLNRGGQWLCSLVLPEVLAESSAETGGLDMIGTLAHPGGLLSRMRDPLSVGGALLDQLRGEQWTKPYLKERIDRFEASLQARFGSRPANQERSGPPCLHLEFDTPHGVLGFFTIQSVFDLAHDVTSGSLRVELWYPLDEHTRRLMVQNAPPPQVETLRHLELTG